MCENKIIIIIIIIITITIIIIIITLPPLGPHCLLSSEKLLPEEQKGCKRGSRGTKDQLLIDKTALKDCKKRHTNLSMELDRLKESV